MKAHSSFASYWFIRIPIVNPCVYAIYQLLYDAKVSCDRDLTGCFTASSLAEHAQIRSHSAQKHTRSAQKRSHSAFSSSKSDFSITFRYVLHKSDHIEDLVKGSFT